MPLKSTDWERGWHCTAMVLEITKSSTAYSCTENTSMRWLGSHEFLKGNEEADWVHVHTATTLQIILGQAFSNVAELSILSFHLQQEENGIDFYFQKLTLNDRKGTPCKKNQCITLSIILNRNLVKWWLLALQFCFPSTFCPRLESNSNADFPLGKLTLVLWIYRKKARTYFL